MAVPHMEHVLPDLILLLVLFYACHGALAECRLRDFAGSWAFTESGALSNGNLPLNLVGLLKLDGKGHVLDGSWGALKLGSAGLHVYYSGNYSIGEHCRIKINLSRSEAQPFTLVGVVRADKRQFYTYTETPGMYAKGEFTRVNPKKCTLKDLQGIYVGSGVRTIDNPGLNEAHFNAFSEQTQCNKNGDCTLYLSSNPTIPLLTSPFALKARMDPAFTCRVELENYPDPQFLVIHSEGLYRVNLGPGNHVSVKLRRGLV